MRWNGWDYNVSSNPEHCGLRIIATADDPDACYSFDSFMVWQDIASGDFYYAQDSGCSCPSPFEDIHSLDDLNRLDEEHWPAFTEALKDWMEGKGDEGAMEAHQLLMKTINAMQEATQNRARNFAVEGQVIESYLDDGGTAYGVTVGNGNVWIEIQSAIIDPQDIDYTAYDHSISSLVGQRVRVTVEVVKRNG